VRKNIFLAYCPSWIVAADHLHSDPDWIKTLNREQRIIMRNYTYAYDHTKPPAADFPLFLDRKPDSTTTSACMETTSPSRGASGCWHMRKRCRRTRPRSCRQKSRLKKGFEWRS
jgi:hypothetical protein